MPRTTRQQPNWLETFRSLLKNTEAPEKYVYWSGIATVAAALRREVCFPQRPVFTLYPNHYIILTGPPGLKKTTAVQFGVRMLEQVEGINIGPSAATWQNLVDELVKIQTPSAEETARTGIVSYPSAPLLLPAGELGTLISFEDRESIDFYTSAWESPDTFAKWTRLMGKQNINGPCLTMTSGTTPQWIADNVKGATRGGGFISRCIMPYAKADSQDIAYPDEYIVDNYQDVISSLIHDLGVMSQLKGDYALSPAARARGKEWYAGVKEEMRSNAIGADSDNWIARKYVHVHKLAMVIAAAHSDVLVIEENDMQEAISRIEEVGKDFNEVFALTDQRKETKGAKDVEAYMRAKGQATHSVLLAEMRSKFTKREVNDALAMLQGAGVVEQRTETVVVKTPQGPQVLSGIVVYYRGSK